MNPLLIHVSIIYHTHLHNDYISPPITLSNNSKCYFSSHLSIYFCVSVCLGVYVLWCSCMSCCLSFLSLIFRVYMSFLFVCPSVFVLQSPSRSLDVPCSSLLLLHCPSHCWPAHLVISTPNAIHCHFLVMCLSWPFEMLFIIPQKQTNLYICHLNICTGSYSTSTIASFLAWKLAQIMR